VKLMILLVGDSATAPIDAHLRANATVLVHEELDPAEAITITGPREGTPTIERGGSALRALWVLEAPSREAAVAIAREAPGAEGTLEIRESFTPQDLGAPPDAPPPPLPPARTAGTHRYIALLRSDPAGETGIVPSLTAVAAMGVYCAALTEDQVMLAGEGLKASARGSRVRRAAAQRFVLDGPFTESKELVAGYLIVQTRTIDDALEAIRPWLRIHLDAVDAIHRDGHRVFASVIEVRRLR